MTSDRESWVGVPLYWLVRPYTVATTHICPIRPQGDGTAPLRGRCVGKIVLRCACTCLRFASETALIDLSGCFVGADASR